MLTICIVIYMETTTTTETVTYMECHCPCRRCRCGEKMDCAGCVGVYADGHVEISHERAMEKIQQEIAYEAERDAACAKETALNQSGHIWYRVACVAYRTMEIRDCNCQD